MQSIKEISLKSWPPGAPTEAQYPLGKVPLAEYLKMRAQEHPDKPAIIFYGRTITYRELDEASNCLANYLLQQGVKKGDRVALFLLNCPQYHIAHYAAWKIGAVVAPCSPLFKEMELEYELNDAGAETLVTLDVLFPVVQKVLDKTPVKRVITTNLNDFLPEEPTLPITDVMKIKKSPIPGTADLMEIIANGDTRPPEVKVELDDLALLQYTGGTTGLPKGAMLTQFAALFKSATAYANARVVRPESIVLAIAPIFHIAGMLVGVDAPILAGATVVLLVGFDPETAMMAIDKYKVNYFTGTVPMNVAIMNHPNVGKYDLSSLRLTLTMSFGIALTEEIAKQWAEVTKGGILVEAAYGLSETHTFDTFVPLNKIKYGTCGIPNAETDIRIFDFNDRSRELPIGEEGEIAVKGPANFKGYWNKPEATAETLIDGWVYTGDVGKFDEDGYLYFLGRRKEMIKVSGFSVFPEEVEMLLCKHPAVAQAAVIPKPDPHKGEVIKAFIILKPGVSATAEEIQVWAKQNMSSYKVPAEIVFTDSFPMSGAGKVLRRLLKP
ncbi:MAG: AMP-binding protein [Syntrophomonadaceae bacterium]|nr:AMP-binding protein [Syntrophomonadaceae bacterium]